jgi:hypothetical protein
MGLDVISDGLFIQQINYDVVTSDESSNDDNKSQY